MASTSNAIDRITELQTQIEVISSVIGISVDDLSRLVTECTKGIGEFAGVLDGVARDCGIAQTTGGGAAIAGGVLAGLGILAAPFTAGASLTLTGVGAALGVAGGVTSFTAAMVEKGWNDSKVEDVKSLSERCVKHLQVFSEFMNQYVEALKEFERFLETEEGRKLIESLKTTDFWNGALQTGKAAKQVYNIASTTLKVKQCVQLVKLVRMLKPDLVVKGFIFSGLKMPGFLGGKVLIQAASTGAKALSSVLAVAGIGFGIWDVVQGTDKIKEGSEVGKQFREMAEGIKESYEQTYTLYKQLYLDVGA